MEKLKNIRFKEVMFPIAVLVMLCILMRVNKIIADIIVLSSFSSVILLHSLKQVSKVLEKHWSRVKNQRPRPFRLRERQMIAYHEAGHAIMFKILFPHHNMEININPLSEICSGYVKGEEISYPQKSDLIKKITIFLAGMKAEQIAFGEHHSGASCDLKMAKDIAYDMLQRYGMGKRFIYSKESKEMDEEINELLTKCAEDAENILRENKSILEALKQELIIKEEMDKEEVNKFFNKYGI